jgi:hypothetical protein
VVWKEKRVFLRSWLVAFLLVNLDFCGMCDCCTVSLVRGVCAVLSKTITRLLAYRQVFL